MRHGKSVKKLGRKKEHREALFRNLLCSLLTYERIKTTLAKAKEVKRLADKLIAFARVDNLANRRRAQRILADKKLVKKLFAEYAPLFKERKGGYCRIYRSGFRVGDNAEMAIIELMVKGEKK
ncbi:MAG: 50S ribosomal protein L17 [candidate division WOR-3 bacterium]